MKLLFHVSFEWKRIKILFKNKKCVCVCVCVRVHVVVYIHYVADRILSFSLSIRYS